MDAIIHAAHGEVEVVTDGEGITFTLAGRTVHRSWAGITGAGLASYGGAQVTLPRDSIELPGGRRVPFDIVPLGGRLEALNRRLSESHRALMIGDNGTGFQVALPVDDPGTRALVSELRARLGARWRGDAWEMSTLRHELGMRTSWSGRVLGPLFVIVVVAGGLLAIAAWAGIKAAWEEGDVSLLRPYTVIPLVLWVIVVWYLLRRLRHRTPGA